MGRVSFLVSIILTLSLLAAPRVEQINKEEIVIRDPGTKNLKVVVAQGTADQIGQRPALLGDWTFPDNKAVFKPRFPLEPGVSYRIFLDQDAHLDAQVLLPPGPAPRLQAVYPSTGDIPENTLRFYLLFDRPMRRGEAYQRVRILDDRQKPVDQPFLELDEELWNRDQTRLTLLIDPGRIKQDVKPRDDLGPVFREGKTFTLVIDGQWADRDGRRLGNSIERSYRIGPPLKHPPRPEDFQLLPPTKTSSSLQVTSLRRMDYGLALRCIQVRDAQGKEVSGKVSLGEHEKSWQFTPDQVWKPGTYQIRIDKQLEDLSGNGIDRPFEMPIQPQKKNDPSEATPIELPFVIR